MYLKNTLKIDSRIEKRIKITKSNNSDILKVLYDSAVKICRDSRRSIENIEEAFHRKIYLLREKVCSCKEHLDKAIMLLNKEEI